MKHVISTLAADMKYVGWIHQAGINSIEKVVLVRGGAGVVMQSASGLAAGTPGGLRTEVSDEDAAWLLKDPHFKEHAKRGFVKIVDKPVDPEKAADSMATDDGGRPKNSDDVKKDADDAAKKAGLSPDETLQVQTNGKKK
jgi:hypothetical protein